MGFSFCADTPPRQIELPSVRRETKAKREATHEVHRPREAKQKRKLPNGLYFVCGPEGVQAFEQLMLQFDQ